MNEPDRDATRALHVLVYSAQMEAVGGIESHVVEFCLRLAAEGHHISLMSSRFALGRDATRQLRAAGVDLIVNREGWSTRSPLRKWLWTRFALLRLAPRRFNVVYVNGQGKNAAAVHSWFRGKARTVHHHHTSCDSSDVAAWPAAYVDAMRRADALVVCAGFIRDRMRNAIGRDQVEVVYCFSRELTRTRSENTPSTPSSFGYFGRLISEKGIDWILRLSEEPRLSGITWKIWGTESTYRASDFGAHSNVEYKGAFASADGLQTAIDTLDCFCLFSTHPEGLPIALIEVMAAGTPWIATSQGGIPELTHDSQSCVLVCLDDYEQVVSACAQMSRRIDSGRIDTARQQAFYRSHFAGTKLLVQWLNLLHGASEPSPHQVGESGRR